ncbi:MAG: hypothetical protein K8L99_03350 [Anaerolineae bacterium]|nr:hypothetical protein [Anaerolineae bacterium]
MSHKIQLPPEVQHIVSDRNKIWQDFDAAKGQANELNKHAQSVGSGKTGTVKQPLTQSDDPRAEVNAVMMEVNKQMGELSRVEGEIKSTRDQIQSIQDKANRMMMMIGGGGVAAVIAIILLLSGG